MRSLLLFARRQPAEKKPVDINQTIQSVLELRTYEYKLGNIQVNTQFAPDLPTVIASASQLQQVFMNIIVNAEYFMLQAHGKGTLTITTERISETVRATFVDDGPGISQANLKHVFTPFFTTKEVGKGTGLGLSICHGIIAEHGGSIRVESQPGQGATFIVALPVRKALH